MSYFIYNLIIHIIFILILPVYLLKIFFTEKYRKTWKDRFALIFAFSQGSKEEVIWIHAASAGEIKTAAALIKRMKIFTEDKDLFITTSTHSGFILANKEFKDNTEIHMLPFDLPWLIGPVVKKINPVLTIIIEPDFWPNFVKYASRHGQLLMINAWFDKKILHKIKKIPGLLPEVLGNFDKITVQSSYDKKHFKKIVQKNKIEITGNIKYDQTDLYSEANTNKLKEDLKINEDDLVLIAGSTHKGEEKVVLSVYKKLKIKFKNLVLIIAPRHIERTDEIMNIAYEMGLNPIKKTVLMEKNKRSEDIIIHDTMGELVDIYPLGIITFMGRTLTIQGGHNILEPLAAGNPVIFGPYYSNFKDVFDQAKKSGVGYEVKSEEDLLKTLDKLLENKNELIEIKNKAQKLIKNNKGVLRKNIVIIEEMIGG